MQKQDREKNSEADRAADSGKDREADCEAGSKKAVRRQRRDTNETIHNKPEHL
jgi:hypothetical protein